MKKTIIYTLLFSAPLLLTACQPIDELFTGSQDYGYKTHTPAPSRVTTSRSSTNTATTSTRTSSSTSSNNSTTSAPRSPVTTSTSNKARAVVPVEPPIAAPKVSSSPSVNNTASDTVTLPKANAAVTKVPAASVNVPTAVPSMAPPSVGQ